MEEIIMSRRHGHISEYKEAILSMKAERKNKE